MATVDLKDAYLSIPVHSNDRKYYRFRWGKKHYEFQRLCFGLTTAPWVFTKMLKPIVAFFRKHGIFVIAYLDDLLVLADDFQTAVSQLAFVKKTLSLLGFIVSSKSMDVPSQIVKYLGFMVNSVDMTVSIPPDKLEKIKEKFRLALEFDNLSLNHFQSLMGFCSSTIIAVPFSRLYSREIQASIIPLQVNLEKKTFRVTVTPEVKEEFKFWANLTPAESVKDIAPEQAVNFLFTDSSEYGYGACFQNRPFSGYWTEEELTWHINDQELMAVCLAFEYYIDYFRDKLLIIMTDNTTVMHYLNKQGGRKKRLTTITMRIYKLAIANHVTISSQHIPGKKNVIADYLSRLGEEHIEWKLDYNVLQPLFQQHRPTIDLFAKHHNNRLPRWVSWKPHPRAVWADAFSRSWVGECPYLYPPTKLVLRVLKKILWEGIPKSILIAPHWPTQPYYPLLMRMLIQDPIVLPFSEYLVICPLTQKPHPLQEVLHLTCYIIKGSLNVSETIWEPPLLC